MDPGPAPLQRQPRPSGCREPLMTSRPRGGADRGAWPSGRGPAFP